MIPLKIRRLRSHLLRYAGEFMIIFLSITFTWWFDEWRQEKADREEEVFILKNPDANLLRCPHGIIRRLLFSHFASKTPRVLFLLYP